MDFNSFVYNNRLDHNVPIVLGMAKVEFRTCASDAGEFGFDWFRVGDNGDNAFSKIVAQSQLNLLENGVRCMHPNEASSTKLFTTVR